MRHLLTAVLTGAMLVFLASPASAQLSVSGDIPVSYSFDESALGDESVSGLKLAVNLPFLLGLGLENYTVEGKLSDTYDFEHKVTMYDVFLDIPFPALNLSVGGGVGKGEFESEGLTTATGITFDDAPLRQFFAVVGVPFAVLFDAHVGYHRIGGEADASNGGEIDLSAEMWTVGLRVGF